MPGRGGRGKSDGWPSPRKSSAFKTHATASPGGPGARTSASASGARSARTTATNGDAWSYFTHDQARSRAYRWGEDGLAGISDDQQRLCFALALWNEQRPDPQGAALRPDQRRGQPRRGRQGVLLLPRQPADPRLPCAASTSTRRRRSRTTTSSPRTGAPARRHGVRAARHRRLRRRPLLRRRGRVRQGRARRHPLPHHGAQPRAGRRADPPAADAVVPQHVVVGPRRAAEPAARADPAADAVRADTRSSAVSTSRRAERRTAVLRERDERRRLWGDAEPRPYAKDGIDDHVVHGASTRSTPTERAPRWRRTSGSIVPPAAQASVRGCASSRHGPGRRGDRFAGRSTTVVARAAAEADEFYDAITPPCRSTPTRRAVMRQALAGMLWSKQSYYFDVDVWLREHRRHPLRAPQARRGRATRRGSTWSTTTSSRCPTSGSTPGTRRGTWRSTASPLTMVDPDFAKSQLDLMLSPAYLHPSGQIPAYEWNFGDVNPPVHAFATLFMHRLDAALRGDGHDLDFLEVVSQAAAELHVVGQPQGPAGQQRVRGRLPRPRQHRRVRPQRAAAHRRPPGAGRRHGVDGVVQPEHARAGARPRRARPDLRGLRVQVRRALLLDRRRPSTRSATTPTRCGTKRTASSTTCCACPTAPAQRLKVRSLVGLLPLCATTVIEQATCSTVPAAASARPTAPRAQPGPARQHRRPARARRRRPRTSCRSSTRTSCAGSWPACSTRSASSARTASARFSRWHLDAPVRASTSTATSYRVAVRAGRVDTGMFGGNSNWRGPVWFPVNLLIIRALLQHYRYYGDDFTIECPTGSGHEMTLFEVAKELSAGSSARSCRGTRRPAPGLRRDRAVPGRPALARPHPVLRVLPRRQRRRARRLAPDRLDRPGGAAHPALRPPRRRDAPGRGWPATLEALPRPHGDTRRRCCRTPRAERDPMTELLSGPCRTWPRNAPKEIPRRSSRCTRIASSWQRRRLLTPKPSSPASVRSPAGAP